MARIDVAKIEGFDAMSAEEKVNALLGFEIEEPKKDDAEINHYKQLISKANAEAADYRKQLRDKQTEAERAEADRLERENALQEELKAYKARERVSTYKAKYMSIGYDAVTAETLANATPEGMTDEFFATQKTFLDQQKQNALSEALNRQPKPSVGTPPSMADAEQAELANYRKAIGLT